MNVIIKLEHSHGCTYQAQCKSNFHCAAINPNVCSLNIKAQALHKLLSDARIQRCPVGSQDEITKFVDSTRAFIVPPPIADRIDRQQNNDLLRQTDHISDGCIFIALKHRQSHSVTFLNSMYYQRDDTIGRQKQSERGRSEERESDCLDLQSSLEI